MVGTRHRDPFSHFPRPPDSSAQPTNRPVPRISNVGNVQKTESQDIDSTSAKDPDLVGAVGGSGILLCERHTALAGLPELAFQTNPLWRGKSCCGHLLNILPTGASKARAPARTSSTQT